MDDVTRGDFHAEYSGLIAMQLGLEDAIRVLQERLDEVRLRTAAMQARLSGTDDLAQFRVKGKRRTIRTEAAGSGWPTDPEERKAEMRRRRDVAQAKKARSAQSSGAKSRWANMSKKARAEWMAKMQAGRRKQQAQIQEVPAA